ncbi:MAG TPA: tRNA (N6-threonylcarbamoyladenosine(37)-N6)-methyltransferase TrmO [Bacteroidales bacterium]|nr:tRNA (N6-threonylcarbamoyladenosine(37)-N6)-methyltransferase TrmO [Bacteroidales bacterium]
MVKFTFKPVGFIKTQNREPNGTPIQAAYARDCTGKAEILPEYIPGLKDLEGFSHIILIYVFDRYRPGEYKLHVKPYLDNKKRGVFATRAPKRPNNIGFSIVKVDQIKNNMIFFSGADMLDNTPILDIKPYVPEFDNDEKFRIGWLEGKIDLSEKKKADERF